ncbi:MAG: patatin-like phospholipase family protein [Chromatiaceae bacterium]|jgi:predicted acylesterase/phospholipase RssA
MLEKLRIPIDALAGTSMGSLVGGSYAAGLSPEELERRITKVNWNDPFNALTDLVTQHNALFFSQSHDAFLHSLIP